MKQKKEDNDVTTTFRVLCSVVFLYLVYVIIQTTLNFGKFGMGKTLFIVGLVLLCMSFFFRPVVFGKYSYIFKLMNKSNQPENKLIESIFLGSVVLIFSYALIRISIYPSKYETTTLIFLYIVCIYAIVECTRLMFTGKKKTSPKKKLDDHENNTQ